MQERRAARGAFFALGIGTGALLVLASCTFVRDLDYLSSSLATEAGPEDPTDPPETSTTPPPVTDTGVPVEAGCVKGTVRRPTRFFELKAEAPGGDPQAVTCDVGNVIDDDGKVVGLDRSTANGELGKGRLAGKDVAGCVGVEFAADVVLSNVAIRMGHVADACGVSPCTPDDPVDGCDTAAGLQANLFIGADEASLQFLSNPRYGLGLDVTRELVPPALSGGHVVVVCRAGLVAVTRDDVGVDAIWTECE